MSAVVLDGDATVDQILAVAGGAAISLDGIALAQVARNREALERLLASGASVYGINTGFGALVTSRVAPEHQGRLQLNLLRSHAAGVGADLPLEVVRAAIAIRISGLLRGHSGVRPIVLERVVELLNAGYVPRVPATGSLGASGDLAPSAHAFLPLVGEGEVYDSDGALVGGGDALRAVGLEPLSLEGKEGLALINGTHFMTAVGVLLSARVAALLDGLDLIAAMTVDALRGAPAAFDVRVHRLRPLPGQGVSAANIRAALRGSARLGSGPLQDAYSLRCAAQVHGAAREALRFFASLVEVDLCSVTDNPLVFDDPPEVISGGNFHGQSLALAFDTLRIALADLGSISERRVFRLLSPSLNGSLPAFLTRDAGASSGYMVAQYTAAALVSELRALAQPVSIDNVPTSDSQEDHVSMGMTGALLALAAVPRLEQIAAIELLCGCQALDCDPGPTGVCVAQLWDAVRELVPVLLEDRPPSADVAAVLPLVRDGVVAAILRGAATSEEIAA
ncbi:MAG TPA: aromatic amino acid ammonia-lyase [Solirubrobacteraceae bacterium]|nr:aromatic amino acid ammonia-lyase [Solirubrobacteraceae bacterium]